MDNNPFIRKNSLLLWMLFLLRFAKAQTFQHCGIFESDYYLQTGKIKFGTFCNQHNVDKSKQGYWVEESALAYNRFPQYYYVGDYHQGNRVETWYLFVVKAVSDTTLVEINTYKHGLLDGITLKFTDKQMNEVLIFQTGRLVAYYSSANWVLTLPIQPLFELKKCKYFIEKSGRKYLNRVLLELGEALPD